jgi:hypothetical protein
MKKETNRNFCRITTFLTLVLSLFLSISCQQEEISVVPEANHKTISSQKISTHEVLNEINNPSIKKYISGLSHSFEHSQSKNFNLALFTKIIKENQYTTYSFLVNNYSIAKPYFSFFVIQKTSSAEKAGFAKYIPATAVTHLDVPHFTGILELYDIDNTLYARTSFVNGQAIPTPTNTASKGQECGNVISIITHNCSHGGNHSPGQSCNNGYSNDGYYEVIIRVVCHTVNSITPPPDAYVGQSGGGSAGGGGLIPDVDEIFAFTESLTVDEKEWLAQNLPTYNTLVNNLVQNHWTDESKDFANEVIDRMRQEPGVFKNINPFIIEKEIDDSQLNTCTKDVLNKIKTLQQNDFSAIIGKLGGANTPYKLTIKPRIIPDPEKTGITNWIKTTAGTAVPYNYNIDLNSSYLVNSTDLGKAGVMLHELIHAYFLSLVDDHDLTGDNTLNSFPILWDYYVDNFTGGGGGIAQHNQMATSYINILASALQEFKTGVAVQANVEPLQIYKDLAWGGLKGTKPYNLLSADYKTRIDRVNQAEHDNKPQNNSNGVPTYFPLGSPCN